MRKILYFIYLVFKTLILEVFGAKPQGLAEVKEYTYTTGEGFANFITHFVSFLDLKYIFVYYF